MAVLGRRVAAKGQVMLVGSGGGNPQLVATVYGPVPEDCWVTAFGGRVGTRGSSGQAMTIGAFTVGADGTPEAWLGEASFNLTADLSGGAGETVEARQSIVGTGLSNQGIPLRLGSYVAIYAFSTAAAAVSYMPDASAATLTRSGLSVVPEVFGDATVVAGRALDLYLETAPNNALPFVRAAGLDDALTNGNHVLTPFRNPSAHVAVWGGEPAVAFSRYDLIDEQHGDELSSVHLQLSSAPDVGSLVWERELAKGEFHEVLQSISGDPALEMVASYIGPKLAPGTYYLRARFADHFGQWSDWTAWLDAGGARAKAVWVDHEAHYLAVSPGTSPIGRIDAENPAAFEAILDAESTHWATRAHLVVSSGADTLLDRVVLSEVVDISAGPGQLISVPWDSDWDDLPGGQQFGYRLRALAQGTYEPVDNSLMALWLDASSLLATLANGTAVASWPDRRGNGTTLVQATSGARPSFRTGILNGHPVVRFAGDDWLSVASTLGITAQPFAVYAVWRPSGASQALMTWGNGAGTLLTDLDNDVAISSGSALFDLNHHAFGQWHIVAGVHAGASSSLTVDGGTPTTGTAGSGIPSGTLTIGAGIAGGDRWLDGDLAELLIIRHVPTTTERRRIEGYLAHRFGLAANLPGGHPYKAAPPDADTAPWYVSNAPEWQRFRTNAVPTVPQNLAPDGSEGVGSYPLLVAIASDADDTPATGFGVRFKLQTPAPSTIEVLAQLREGTVNTWEYQTTADEVPETGTYIWSAQAFDSVATSAWSADAEFVYGVLPVVAITAPTDGATVTSGPIAVTWTSDTLQAAKRVRLYDVETDALAYDSGTIVSTSLSQNVPTTDLQHGRQYRVLVEVTIASGLVGSDEVAFTMQFSLPATPSGFTAEPLALAGDIEPTVVELSWTESAEGAFVAYRVTRQASQDGDDGTAEVTLATIETQGTTGFIDQFPASDIPYTYRLYVVGQRGASEVASAAALDTAEIELSTVVLTAVGFGSDLRAVLRYVEGSSVEQQTDETLLVPWGDSAPTSFEGTTDYRTINSTFALVTDAAEDAAAAMAAVRRMTRAPKDPPGPRPIVCYRDDRGRKLFATVRMREEDREILWYGLSLQITETNYTEGSA